MRVRYELDLNSNCFCSFARFENSLTRYRLDEVMGRAELGQRKEKRRWKSQ